MDINRILLCIVGKFFSNKNKFQDQLIMLNVFSIS